MRCLNLFSTVSALAMALGIATAAHAADASPQVQFVPPPPPVPPVSGYVGVGVGISTQPDNFSNYPYGTGFAFGGAGAASVWLNPGTSLQFDVEAEGAGPFGYENQDYSEARFSGVVGGHVDWRSSSHAVGAFLGFTGANTLYYCGANIGALGGLEGQAYLGMTTLYGQAGYGGQFNDADCGMLDKYWFVRGVVRHFINPDLKIEGEVAYAAGESQDQGSPPPSLNLLTWGVSVEKRVTGSPFSYHAAYAGDHLNGPYAVTQHTFLVGAKMNFGTGTLFDNDRQGATFDMPDFYRGMPWSCIAGDC